MAEVEGEAVVVAEAAVEVVAVELAGVEEPGREQPARAAVVMAAVTATATAAVMRVVSVPPAMVSRVATQSARAAEPPGQRRAVSTAQVSQPNVCPLEHQVRRIRRAA